MSDSPRAAKLLACESVVLAQGGTVLRYASPDEKYKEIPEEIEEIKKKSGNDKDILVEIKIRIVG